MAAGVVKRVLLASPRGYCAGVERAVETVERALRLYGPPVYVRRQIVHNAHVVRDLEGRGAVFVADERDVPEGATLVLSGHAGHEEVEGTMGEAPQAITLVESVEDAEALDLPDGQDVAYVTQTTLSVDETAEIVSTLRRRFPHMRAPLREDICYATSNRQWAVKQMLGEIDLLLVIGSANSSNSNRLVEVARAAGVEAYLIEDETEIDESWLDGVETVGLTSGASAPESLVARVCDWFRRRGVREIEGFASVYEDVVFKLPVELRRAETPAA